MRATSKRLCLIASIALSKSTLSGCLEPTLASGLTDFLLVQAAVIKSNRLSAAIDEYLRDIKDLKSTWNCVGTAALGCPPSEARLCSIQVRYRCRKDGQAAPGDRVEDPVLHFDGPTLFAAPLPSPPSAAPVHSCLDRRYRTRRCPPPEFLPRPAPRRPRYPAPRR